MMSEIASMLGECNFWIGWLNLAGEDKKVEYYTKARFWYEIAHYVIGRIRYDPSMGDRMGEIAFILDPIENKRTLKEKKGDVKDDTLGYLMEHGFLSACRINIRLKDTPEDDYNHRALLLLKKADCLYELGMSAPQRHRESNPLSSDKMAYDLCKEILKMEDGGIDLWPRIVHTAIVFILLRYPKLNYEKMKGDLEYRIHEEKYAELNALLDRGLKNAENMGEEFRQEVIKAFAVAMKELNFIPEIPKLIFY